MSNPCLEMRHERTQRCRSQTIRGALASRLDGLVGVCSVQLNREGKIKRNEVYFDRSRLLAQIEETRSRRS